MKLEQLQVTNIRNLEGLNLSLSPQLNVFLGQNGSGKSSLLEAIHFLGFGRSFRTSIHKHVVRHGESQFSVFSQCVNEQEEQFKLGLSRTTRGEVTVSINGEHSSRVMDLVSHLPVQIFTPQSTDLIIGSPKLRRRFLDWGLFHVEQSFSQLSLHYNKVLKHRNALLRKAQKGLPASGLQEMDYWDEQLVRYGESLDRMRNAYVEALKGYLRDNLKQFLTEFSPEISYHRGWEKETSLRDALVRKRESDIRNGFTSSGPHKADLLIKVNQTLAANSLSRGQLRMLVAAMQLSQTLLLKEKKQHQCVFLLDDIGAELDSEKRKQFVDALVDSGAQVIITAIDSQQTEFVEHYSNKKMFHVEHGQVKEETI